MRILVIEDDVSIREMLSECLAEEGYEVASAQHGRAALEYLRTQRPLPDLMLLDAAMPVMNGWEFLAAQEQDPVLADIPVVMLTAAGDLQQRRYASAGVRRAAKPINLDTLLNLVAEYRDRPGGAYA